MQARIFIYFPSCPLTATIHRKQKLRCCTVSHSIGAYGRAGQGEASTLEPFLPPSPPSLDRRRGVLSSHRRLFCRLARLVSLVVSLVSSLVFSIVLSPVFSLVVSHSSSRSSSLSPAVSRSPSRSAPPYRHHPRSTSLPRRLA
ncbi:hypothetical protein FS749_003159 [Ceratobasidium sp. UAMH 11750]|nr:hypothetical protein FS749_003159 [Ceratobasidium sp. UAMH 11750]